MKIAAYEENGVVITVHPAPALFDENSRDRIELAVMGIIFENEEEVYNFIFTKISSTKYFSNKVFIC
jgi:hypothetical protein